MSTLEVAPMFIPRTVALMFCVFSVMLSGLRCTSAPAAPSTGDPASLLGGRTWTTESITFNGSDVTTEGVRTLVFAGNGSYTSTLHNGASISGTWAVSPDGERLVLDEGALEESVFELDEISTTRLRMSWTGERDDVSGRYEYVGRAEG